MRRIARYATLAPMALLVVGCSYHFGAAQTRDEFIAAAKSDTPFHGTESMTVARPFNAVVADVKAYADRCLNVTLTTRPIPNEARSTRYYRARVETPQPGLATLTLRSENRAKGANNGAPPGGLYRFAADIRQGKARNTLIDLYYVGSGSDASEYLKPWVDGGKRECPEF
jgi:hypothetical protein